ncbi:MAG: hypothetical protein HQL03_12445 [Nitrospirae bacterium]|nr:hypothetical protein [Nitrospirota bacterium]MBF0592726.1 hypothetical protein [Nitrospirota bacterium]
MRFLFYDRITEIDKGKAVSGVKTFALSEEFFRGHFSKKAIIPGVIFIEAMAQLLGWLIIYTHDFRLSAIMSLVEGVKVAPMLRPGLTADICGQIVSTSKRDSLGKAQVFIEGKEVASIQRIIFSHVHRIDPDELKRRFTYYSGLTPGQ